VAGRVNGTRYPSHRALLPDSRHGPSDTENPSSADLPPRSSGTTYPLGWRVAGACLGSCLHMRGKPRITSRRPLRLRLPCLPRRACSRSTKSELERRQAPVRARPQGHAFGLRGHRGCRFLLGHLLHVTCPAGWTRQRSMERIVAVSPPPPTRFGPGLIQVPTRRVPARRRRERSFPLRHMGLRIRSM
jgi:hypothetical protein